MVLALMVTKQCNFRCEHCMVDSSKEFSLISPSIVDKYYDMLKIGCPDDVFLLGGEPFLHIDTIENIIEMTKPYCERIVVFSNGTFLLDNSLTERIQKLGVTIRISDDKFHRKSWTPELEQLIQQSEFWIVPKDTEEDMIPVGRAYQEFKHLRYNMGCSLLTGKYGDDYPNGHRYMIMLNGDVNLYCATIQGALANVFEDEKINYYMLVEREKILHNYLMKNVISCIEDTYMAKMCNLCQRYKVTEKNILFDGKVVADNCDYKGYYIDFYEHLKDD